MEEDEDLEMEMEEDEDLEMEMEEDEDLEMEDSHEELEEAYRVVNFLKKQLREVNLLNTKLVYANRLFSKFNLTESQKSKVIDILDKVTTSKEAKLVYASLIESYRNVNKKKKLRESFSSNRVTRKNTNNVIGDNFTDRMKKLANIK